MPLPNYGYFNKEDQKHQELVFEMAPEFVDDDTYDGKSKIFGNSRKRGKITTGKLGIDVERKMVIDTDKDKDLWVTTVDPQDIAEARKFSSPERQVLRREVKSSLGTLMSGDKLKQIRGARRPTIDDKPDQFSSYTNGVDEQPFRFDSFRTTTSPGRMTSSSPPRRMMNEESRTGISIQPRGTFKMQQQHHVTSSHHVRKSSGAGRDPRGLY